MMKKERKLSYYEQIGYKEESGYSPCNDFSHLLFRLSNVYPQSSFIFPPLILDNFLLKAILKRIINPAIASSACTIPDELKPKKTMAQITISNPAMT